MNTILAPGGPWSWLRALLRQRCEPTSLPPGPPAGRWPLPLSRRRREISSNKEQPSAVFVILFALTTILIFYSSNSANEVFHYGSLQGRSHRPINLKKWNIANGYVPILGNKGKVPFVVEHWLVHHGDRGGVVQRSRLRRMPYHYYEPKGPDECVTYVQNEHSCKGNHHRFITEKRVFSSWVQLYGITFSHPSWT
ncbi:alpha-N-acetylgalactosaminide alpha-2,6-sialyltransferase 6-like [Molossus molossus]|uniref:alpha-N-acetylgalactosaminide alpha-2,6-sialyltransferase 6-like n=1 Tax=Molossus molossus TaxID=27622 RepID=UPI001746896D|nr:alpha-N-acetylgalactosaminide alpha-2,6-sialyltransferase 6-like [Molossus molossus]